MNEPEIKPPWNLCPKCLDVVPGVPDNPYDLDCDIDAVKCPSCGMWSDLLLVQGLPTLRELIPPTPEEMAKMMKAAEKLAPLATGGKLTAEQVQTFADRLKVESKIIYSSLRPHRQRRFHRSGCRWRPKTREWVCVDGCVHRVQPVVDKHT